MSLLRRLGLIPIGMNPQSKLWEFYHLRSAWDPETQSDPAAIEIPVHGEGGALPMTGRGVVFVLIPGGKFLMGAQGRDTSAPNYYPDAGLEEGPVRSVELAPYLLSKYELTQGQWARLSGGEHPSRFELGKRYGESSAPIGDAHPVETVDWTMCATMLTQHGWALPTEAQWENGYRAGTSTPWFAGDKPSSIEGFANITVEIGDTALPKSFGGKTIGDGFDNLAPVGSFKPNPFGLFDVQGNVWEWCRDWYGPYTLLIREGDGLNPAPASSGTRILRGGSYEFLASDARAGIRYRLAASSPLR